MPEIDILPELKAGYEDLDTIDPTITKILLQQDKGEIELRVYRGQNCKTSQALKYQLFGSWADKEFNTIAKGEVCPEWQFSAKDSLLLNKNRILYGHNELYLDEWGISNLSEDNDKNYLLDAEDEANPVLIKKLEKILKGKGYKSGLVAFNLTDGSFAAQLDESQADGPLIHLCSIFPTDSGIRIEEV